MTPHEEEQNGAEISGYGVTGRFWGGTFQTFILAGALATMIYLAHEHVGQMQHNADAAQAQQAAAVQVLTEQHRDLQEQVEVIAYILSLNQKEREALRLQEPLALRRLRQSRQP